MVPYLGVFEQMHADPALPPNSTNTTATDFGVSDKYANMVNNKSRNSRYQYYIIMLLKALIVRSTTQKDEMPFRTRRDIQVMPAQTGDVSLSLDGTDKLVAVTIEGT